MTPDFENIAENPEELRRASQYFAGEEPRTILDWALGYFGDALLVTTALNAGGVLLLYYLKELGVTHPVYFIDTGKHFKETLIYRDRLVDEFKFSIQSVGPSFSEAEFEERHGPQLYTSDPDLCCAIRKVEPARQLLKGKRAWLSALRRDQNGERRHVEVLGFDTSGTLRVNPLAYVSRNQVDQELERHGIPQHPLHGQGYLSIGCGPCTTKSQSHSERGGRWPGQTKTECGLHARINGGC